MVRLYGLTDWRTMPPSQVAPLAEVAVKQPESWMRREIDPDWQWTLEAQLLGALVEVISGEPSGRPLKDDIDDMQEGRTAAEVDRLLAAAR